MNIKPTALILATISVVLSALLMIVSFLLEHSDDADSYREKTPQQHKVQQVLPDAVDTSKQITETTYIFMYE